MTHSTHSIQFRVALSKVEGAIKLTLQRVQGAMSLSNGRVILRGIEI